MMPDILVALGGLATFASLMVFARNDGKREGKMEALKETVTRRLDEFGRTLEKVNDTLDRNASEINELGRWRAATDVKLAGET